MHLKSTHFTSPYLPTLWNSNRLHTRVKPNCQFAYGYDPILLNRILVGSATYSLMAQHIACPLLSSGRVNIGFGYTILPLSLHLLFFFRRPYLPASFNLEDFPDCFADFQEMTVTISGCNEGQANRHTVDTLEAGHVQYRSM